MANSQRRNNHIDKLKVGDVIIEDKIRIKEEILDYYQKLYHELEPWRPTTIFGGLSSLTTEESEGLEAPFDELEVLAALKACAPDKALGPDGYTMAFFQQCWVFIKADILNTLNYYHQHSHMVKSCNATFIALIPKKKGAIELRDFRPISLIGMVYKITAKILAERLKKIIGKLVSVKYSVLVNRSPVGFFSPEKGLRQGDPLSNFLFILAMDGLTQMMEKAKEMQWIQGFQVGRNPDIAVTISHLLYADDTLVLCGAESSQVSYLNLTLLIFESLSGLHINMLKSIIYLVNEVPNLEELADLLCCKIGSLPTTYLGLPLGAKFKSVGIWGGIIEKMEKKLAT
uniref:Reverse transcriptase domain-containing protein n=1 Tax=Nicotiana tabacum TaxID=4097 RepID=A0A1S4B8D9_TOBAC|nr:PREDICTED: uncharacterized protein LOC107805603 [Nicotiana tabacum]